MNATLLRRRGGTVVGVALALSLLGAPLAGSRAAENAAAGDAVQRIEQLHGTLLEVMRKAGELGFRGRAAKLRPVIEGSYDIRFMAEKALGRYWSELDPRQRERMVDAFRRMTVATYAARFDGYDGESFEIIDDRPSVQDTVLVRSRILRGGGEPVELTYRLRKTDASWRIIDVYLRGTVSELAMRRSEYTSVVRREGFESLVEALDAKVRELSAGDSDTEPDLDPFAKKP